MPILKDNNKLQRQMWLTRTLGRLPAGSRLLDAGAGELENAKYCTHLEYVSQDLAKYGGAQSAEGAADGINPPTFDATRVDIISDITNIPEVDASFDAILCSEVLEHVPEPLKALDELTRLLKPGGILIITAPFASNVHFAPFHYSTGFSRYWYEHHLSDRGFTNISLEPNGDWYALLRQELTRLGSLERQKQNWSWPFAYLLAGIGLLYFAIRSTKTASDIACFGWHVTATKKMTGSGPR